MKQIISALLNAQKSMGNATKDNVNPFFKSKYADLNSVREAVTPLLNANGIVVLQPMCTVDGNEYVKTILMHESGESLESYTKIICKSQNDPQTYGSGVTYARRYGLASFLSIGADDDDGNKASQEPKKVELTKFQKDNEMLIINAENEESLKSIYKSFSEDEQKRLNKLTTDKKTELTTIK
jgi:hypothetical protein